MLNLSVQAVESGLCLDGLFGGSTAPAGMSEYIVLVAMIVCRIDNHCSLLFIQEERRYSFKQ